MKGTNLITTEQSKVAVERLHDECFQKRSNLYETF